MRSVFLVSMVVMLLPAGMICGAESAWYRGEGRASMEEMGRVQARELAYQRARAEAASKAGTQITEVFTRHRRTDPSEDGSGVYQDFAWLTSSITRGLIAECRILDEGVETTSISGNSQGEVVVYYYVMVEAQVTDVAGEVDDEFQIDLSFAEGTNVFRDGDSLRLEVTSTKDCYITVFNLYSADSMQLVYPNALSDANYLKAGTNIFVPPTDAGWKLKVGLLPGRQEDTEAFFVIATKETMPFIFAKGDTKGMLCSMGDGLAIIHKWLRQIDADKRTQALLDYRIIGP